MLIGVDKIPPPANNISVDIDMFVCVFVFDFFVVLRFSCYNHFVLIQFVGINTGFYLTFYLSSSYVTIPYNTHLT